jgi:hypothetical protein
MSSVMEEKQEGFVETKIQIADNQKAMPLYFTQRNYATGYPQFLKKSIHSCRLW